MTVLRSVPDPPKARPLTDAERGQLVRVLALGSTWAANYCPDHDSTRFCMHNGGCFCGGFALGWHAPHPYGS